MTTRGLLKWTGVGIALVLSFVAGLRLGVAVGVDQFLKMDSSARASVLTSELRALRAGKVERIIKAKEIEVDGNVVSALEFQKSGMPWLFWPNDQGWNHARSLGYVAQYRREYPPMVPQLQPSPESPDPADLRGFAREVEQSTRVLVDRYGK
jgi:hypothetical protein